MPTNDFKAFAVAPGANVLSQSEYNSLAAVSTGWQGGVAKSAEVNKAIRQATFIVAALAQFVSDKSNQDVLDDGNIAGFVTKLITAFNQTSQPLDATLTAIAGLVGSANKLAYFTGADTASLTDFTDVGRNIIGKNAIADVLTYLGLGSAAKADTSDFISSAGGNYQAYLRMKGVETLPTETAAANLSSLYSAPSPIQPGDIASGAVANWYNFQAIYGLIRNASNGINGWGIKINGQTLFLVAPNGDCYANNAKLATETVVASGLSGKQDENQTLTDLSGKTPTQINTYLGLGTAATKTIGNGPSQVPDMSLFPLVGGANGYVKLPNGFIFQWGSANAGSGSANIAFPMQFPGGCVGVEITGTSARASADMSAVNIISGETNAGGFGVNGYLIRPGGQVVPQGIAFNYCAWGY